METVIAGVEDSRESRDALRFARQFSDAEGAALHVVSVFADTIFVASLEEIEISRESYFKHMLEVAEEELEQPFEFHEVISTSVPGMPLEIQYGTVLVLLVFVLGMNLIATLIRNRARARRQW